MNRQEEINLLQHKLKLGEVKLAQTLEYLKLEHTKAMSFMKVVREKDLSLNTAIQIADTICSNLNKIPISNKDVWKSEAAHDEFVANWATINHLKGLKHETVEDILGNTLRIDDQQSNSNFNDDGSETNTLHDRSLYQF